jgi:hypothetical protein
MIDIRDKVLSVHLIELEPKSGQPTMNLLVQLDLS